MVTTTLILVNDLNVQFQGFYSSLDVDQNEPPNELKSFF